MSKERDEFVAILTKELPDKPISEVIDIAGKLMRYGRTSCRFAEMQCNREMTEAEEKRDKANDQRILDLVATLGKGFGVKLGGDPRGATVKLIVPSGRTNDWGNEGVCVPGS